MSGESKETKYIKLVSVRRADQISLLKSLLIANNINFEVEGETFSNVYGGALPCRFLVDESQLKEAQQLLEDLGFR